LLRGVFFLAPLRGQFPYSFLEDCPAAIESYSRSHQKEVDAHRLEFWHLTQTRKAATGFFTRALKNPGLIAAQEWAIFPMLGNNP
jgi:hypothetical protein